MNVVSTSLSELYAAALRHHLATRDEATLQEGYELGRRAVSEGWSLLELATAHHAALEALLPGAGDADAAARIARDAGTFLAESVAPFDMAYRGFRDANESLQRLNETLRQQTQELTRSNKELEQFAYVASHDLQEPLRMVASYVQLLERRYRGKLDSEADEFIRFAVDGAKRMQALINDLLAYSRVGTRGGPVAPVRAEVALGRALINLRIAIEEAGATVTHGELPTVEADASQLTQLFQNLIANAVKFRDERRPPRIRVEARPDGEEWVFSVSDNGIGIDPQHFDRIFLLFQRLNPRDMYPGTGIGLAICKKIVDRHGGRMWLESRVDEGTTFYFSLPRAKDQSP